MSQHGYLASTGTTGGISQGLGNPTWEKAGLLYARLALGSAFLSAVAGRFGLWHGTFDPGYFSNFLEYAREVLAFVPTAAVPYLAWMATVSETSLGILLLLGLWPRWVSLASAGLLATFGTSMAISQGLKSPMDYSVYSASSAGILLALHAFRRHHEATQSSLEGKTR